ncbi:DUF4351 domain-containing protein [Synechococcus sp. PCC 7336]|uniref:DUF4351 domain-containing protein n=1 Tax=Synechococcus sp. PCC 7336 TaxID=195250 RepID=UPI000344AA74|nr:DUF4351 domain-containing protein [Synechococcus sp. PCC 7336]
MDRNEYDINLRSLVGDYCQDFLQWLVGEGARVEEIVNSVFTSRERRADIVIRYATPAGRRGILHIEFQRRPLVEMPLRMAEYSLFIMLNYGEAPTQILILLEDSKAAREMPDFYACGGTRVQYKLLPLWEQDPEAILVGDCPGLLPLVPLMGPPNQLKERLEACEAAISERVEVKSRQQDLLAVAVLLSSLQPRGRDAIEEFLRSRKMLDLMESPLLRDWLREAEERGKAEGEAEGEARGKVRGKAEEGQRMLVRLLSHQFGPLPQALSTSLKAIANPERLEELLDAALDATNLEDFQKNL